MTAASFGLTHLNGVPGGVVDVLTATSWGRVGVLRLRTKGTLATYLAHVFADATIIALLIPAAIT